MPRQPLRGRPLLRPDVGDPVDAGQEPPQGDVRLDGQRMQVVDVRCRARLPIGPLRLGVVANVAVDLAALVTMDRDEPAPRIAPAVVADAELELPADVAAADLAGLAVSPLVEHGPGHGDGIGIGRQELDRARVVVVVERRGVGIETPDRLPAAHAIAEAPVDRVLGGVEQADDVAALPHRGMLDLDHPTQDAPSSMGRSDADAGDARRLDPALRRAPSSPSRTIGTSRRCAARRRPPRPATGPTPRQGSRRCCRVPEGAPGRRRRTCRRRPEGPRPRRRGR